MLQVMQVREEIQVIQELQVRLAYLSIKMFLFPRHQIVAKSAPPKSAYSRQI